MRPDGRTTNPASGSNCSARRLKAILLMLILTINNGISSKRLARQCLCLSIFFRRLSLPNRQIVWQCLLSCLAVSVCAVAAVRWRRHFLWESRHLGLGRKPEAGIGSCRLQSIEDSGLTELWIHRRREVAQTPKILMLTNYRGEQHEQLTIFCC